MVDATGAIQAEYPLHDSLTIGQSQGDLTFPADVHMASLNARVFIDDGQLFVRTSAMVRKAYSSGLRQAIHYRMTMSS